MNEDSSKKNKLYSTKEYIIGIIFIILFIGSVGALLYYSKKEPAVCLLIFGLWFMAGGLVERFFSFKKRTLKKNMPMWLIPIVGVGMTGSSAISLWGESIHVSLPEEAVPVLILCIFIIAGFLFILDCFVTVNTAKKHWTPLKAKCVDINKRYSKSSNLDFGSGRFLSAPVFSYTYGEKQYTSQVNIYSHVDIPEIDDDCDIYVNPGNPEEIFRVSIKQLLTPLAAGLALIAAGSYALFLFLGNR